MGHMPIHRSTNTTSRGGFGIMNALYLASLQRLLEVIAEEQKKDPSADMQMILDIARRTIQDRINLHPHLPQWRKE
jgi:hypothetical protein